ESQHKHKPVAYTRRKKPLQTEGKKPDTLEKQRSRNRLAAERCRKRQVSRIQILVDKVEQLEDRRETLCAAVGSLSSQVLGLKEELLRHNDCGCEKIQSYLQSRVDQLLEHPPHRR
ncbi:hypothetical protein EJ05DRAFT_432483, partial [Pseudovirgaria hyperparasitica]